MRRDSVAVIKLYIVLKLGRTTNKHWVPCIPSNDISQFQLLQLQAYFMLMQSEPQFKRSQIEPTVVSTK